MAVIVSGPQFTYMLNVGNNISLIILPIVRNKEKQWDKKHARMYQIIKWVWKFCHMMSSVLSGLFSSSDFLLGTKNTGLSRITQTEHC